MTPKELSQLKRWQVEGLYWSAEKCAGDLSRGCAGLQGERDNLLYENERLRKALSDVADVILKIDWTQVALNHAEPCCHVDDSGKLCGRANKWAGHPSHHKFISLYIYTRAALEQKP